MADIRDIIKTKKIVFELNNKSYASKSVWLTLSHNGLLYISYDEGRIYFFLNKRDNKDTNKMIGSFIFEDATTTANFTYYGSWDDDDSNTHSPNVEKKCAITFNNGNEYKKFKKHFETFTQNQNLNADT